MRTIQVRLRFADQTIRTLLTDLLEHHGIQVVEDPPGGSGTSIPVIEEAHLLSQREVEVLQALADGGSTDEIAARLGVEHSTVDKHLEHIFAKLEAHSRAHAVAEGFRGGWLH